MARMKIFNALEEVAFESPPLFNSEERKRFFYLSSVLNNTMADLRTPTNKVCFLVVAGYFKARRKFFARQFQQTDIEYVARQIGVNIGNVHINAYNKETYARHQGLILNHLGYSPFDEAAKIFTTSELSVLVRIQSRPKLILLEIIQVLIRKKIEIPSYNVLANLLVSELNRYQYALSEIVSDCLSETQCTKLDGLLEKESGVGANDGWRYHLTLLKKPYQSTQPSKIRANLADMKTLQGIYTDLKPVSQRLNLSYECIRYYAYSVIKAQIPQLSQRADRYLHLIAFVIYQTFKLNDTLIDTLLNAVQTAINVAEKEHKNTYFQERDLRHQSFCTLIEQFRLNIRETLSVIKRILGDGHLSDREKVALINKELDTEAAKPKQVEQIDVFKQNAVKIQQGKDYFDLLEAGSLKLQHRVADIVRQLPFSPNCSKPALWEAILHYQKKDGSIDKSAPIHFLSAEQQAALTGTDDGAFRVSLYKALLFVEIAEAIKSGTLNLIHSEKYRSLDEYLISKADWEANHDEYLQRAQLESFSDCKTTLNRLNQTLDKRYQETNENVKTGTNAHLTIRPNGTFHVSTPKLAEVENLPLGIFLPERKYIPLLEVLATVNRATNFLGEFEHWQVKYQRAKPPQKVFFAGIIGYGCDIGHRKLAQISKQIDDNELDNVVNWYFSLQNVQSGNDRILQFMDQMDLPNLYMRKEGVLHTSSDGQKFEVAVDSLNANYSFKYLGKDKGVSVVTFIDMRELMWHSTVMGSGEQWNSEPT
jgi:hypothetical protein